MPSASGSDGASEGHTGWSWRDTRGTSSSGQEDNTVTLEDTMEKFLQIALAELWKLQKLWSSEIRSQHENVRPQPEDDAGSE